MSTEIGELATALAGVQIDIAGAVKGNVNPAFKSKYADLSSVWEAWQAIGPKAGLAVSQLPGGMVDGRATLTTIIAHTSGQWMRDTLSIPLTKQDAQGYGSALTYARRYALAALVGIAPEDDDGNAAVAPQARPKAAPVGKPEASINPGEHDPGGGADMRDKWDDWARKNVTKIAKFDREALTGWRADNDKYLARLRSQCGDIHERLMGHFDDRMLELSPDYVNAG